MTYGVHERHFFDRSARSFKEEEGAREDHGRDLSARDGNVDPIKREEKRELAMSEEQAARLIRAMTDAFPEAMVEGHEALIDPMPNQKRTSMGRCRKSDLGGNRSWNIGSDSFARAPLKISGSVQDKRRPDHLKLGEQSLRLSPALRVSGRRDPCAKAEVPRQPKRARH